MDKYCESLKNILLSKFYYLDIIKNGNFTLKSGISSNLYIDFRKLINYPQLFNYLEELINIMYPDLLNDPMIKLMPIPIGGLPLGNYLSFTKKIPQVIVRDKPKEYGGKKIIEGVYTEEDMFIIVEDVITSGSSIKRAIANLQSFKIDYLNYCAILCICNRSSLSHITITQLDTTYNIPIYSIFTLNEIEQYILKLQHSPDYNINYFAGQSWFSNELYKLALQKQSNLILSCDFMNTQEILNIIENTGSKIVAVKLHLDIIHDNSHIDAFCNELSILKKKYNFMIIEDAKYGDIETIMYEKITKSRMMILEIADAITIHALSGLSILENVDLHIPMIIVSEMSSSDNMLDMNYTKRIIEKLPEIKHLDLLGGLVCQNNIYKMIKPFEYLTMSPGINIDSKQDDSNQQYKIPSKKNKLGLFWIVGRGITNYKNNKIMLQSYLDTYYNLGWQYFITY